MMDFFNVMVGLDMAREREADFARDADTRRLLRASRVAREATASTRADSPPVRRSVRISQASPPPPATVQDNPIPTGPTMQLQAAASTRGEG